MVPWRGDGVWRDAAGCDEGARLQEPQTVTEHKKKAARFVNLMGAALRHHNDDNDDNDDNGSNEDNDNDDDNDGNDDSEDNGNIGDNGDNGDDNEGW